MASDGHFLHGSEHWWSVQDEASARACGQEVVERLNVAVPHLLALLARSAMVQAVIEGDLGSMRGERQRSYFDLVLPALLVDHGFPAELEATIKSLQARSQERSPASASAKRFDVVAGLRLIGQGLHRRIVDERPVGAESVHG